MAAAFSNQCLHLTSIHPCFTSTSWSSKYRGLSSSTQNYNLLVSIHPFRPSSLVSIKTATDPNHEGYDGENSFDWNWFMNSSFRFMEEQLGKLVDQKSSPSSRSSTVDMDGLVDFLYEDIPHVFDDQGIDHTMYDTRLRFRDPITKYDSIYGYLAYIFMLKNLFKPEIQLHYVKQTGPYEISTRWTAMMKLMTVPWKPRLVVTGTSIMHINPENHKFCSHVDIWDSIEQNEYFSVEGSRLGISMNLDSESPNYQILKRTSDYEVRKYCPFVIIETKGGNELSRSSSTGFVQAFETYAQSKISTQSHFLPLDKDFSRDFSRSYNSDELTLKRVEEGIAVVSNFSGEPTEEIVFEQNKKLRRALVRDGLKAKETFLLARYKDSSGKYKMRNEVLIWLEEFRLD
ncbi:hypothetical protein MKW94_014154 [Papaver nudicaule]|uniref:SOUL heme-binding protein n=1 Tax=Papaver nudicaule TaxID=74823 RepID=A0AA41V528_PAPNU|nr:hypothetical protein [Papaver nudicaule]